MGYVKTAEEVSDIQQLLSSARFLADAVTVEFETTTEFVEYLLPPCLEPAAEPLGFVNVSRWQSAYCGEFDAAWVGVKARFEDIEGSYTIELMIDRDTAIATGREQWGEVKKRADMGYYHDGPYIYGYAERYGVRLIEVNAALGPDEGPAEADDDDHTFELKAFPAADGIGLEYDPLLITRHSRAAYRSVRRGSAEITLRGTEFDPLDTVPIVSVGEAIHAVGDVQFTGSERRAFGNRADYLPYVLGRNYDDLRLFPQPARYRMEQPTA
jgi:acetoacetate decarboxylase